MARVADLPPVAIAACDCLTPLGDAATTASALLQNRVALQLQPVLGSDGGDMVPLALLGPLRESLPPRWLRDAARLAAGIPGGDWGTPRRPVVVTSSNFGVGSLHAFTCDQDPRHLQHGAPFASVELLRRQVGWGEHVTIFSHACVSAHLGVLHASRLLQADLADEVLVFSFDFVSPFVAGGFASLKILNSGLPAPYAMRETGSIGLGDGAAYAVLTRGAGLAAITGQTLYNEMHHFTSNEPAGSGFSACADAVAAASRGRRVWIKGHGTGTLEAGRLEAETFARAFPDAPLVSWKGSLGHTLGSCGLVELAIALAAWRASRPLIPGTVASTAPTFTDNVALAPFAADAFDAAILSSNAFGGAHAAFVLELS